jgi:glycosyltransferase involved in cell wall biosynthesis
MLVSIIIPVYNGEKYLRECIDSALTQSYQPAEVIVVDDCSTDETWQIIESYGDKIAKYRHAGNANKGTAAALNTGIRASKGEFIRWLSADDVMLPNGLSKVFTWLNERNESVEDSIFYTSYDIIAQDGSLIKKKLASQKPASKLWTGYFGNGSTTLIHKKVFEKVGLFDETLPHTEDLEFWLRATMLHGIQLKCITAFTIQYRVHPDQLSKVPGLMGSLNEQIRQKIKDQMKL